MDDIIEVEVFENKMGQRKLTFKTLKFLKIAAGTEKLEKKVAVNIQWFPKSSIRMQIESKNISTKP